jgi:hypothetical protein
MAELTVLLIRHAEKPEGSWPGPGLDASGTPDSRSLVIRGWQRAGAWAALFGSGAPSDDYPRPTAIYAANPIVQDRAPDPSRRPHQTIVPMADRLQIEPNTDFAKGDERELAAAVAERTGVILISWEHKAIAKSLLPALLGGQDGPAVPSQWNDARFDVVLRLDRPDAASAWSFRQLFPRLLSGDTDVPL